MRLSQLEATFLRAEIVVETWTRQNPDGSCEEVTGPREHYLYTSLAEAEGVMFLCPLCFAANGGSQGTHSVICWFVGKVPDDRTPKPGRWVPAGTSIEDLTFVGPDAASVLLIGGCNWHGFVKNGDAS
jgi:hypothetical protein